MTTLELLNEIEKAPAFMGGSERYKSVAGSDILYQQDIERIRKELKILEILKKYIRVNELRETPQIMTGSPNVDIVLNVVKNALDSSIFLDLMLQEDAKIIKEWLNEKINTLEL